MRAVVGVVVLFNALMYFSPSVGAVGANDTRPAELAFSNKKLNSTYQLLLKRLSTENQTNLRAAQRAWIKFRDLDCKWAFAAEINDCLIDRTESRIEQLNETLFFDPEGNYETLNR